MSKSAAANAPIIEVEESQYALLRDEKSSGTNGGTFTSGAWRTRELNTKVTDEIGITLSSNQFTLPAGTYDIVARAPAYFINTHKARLRNITDDTTVTEGTSEKSNDDASFSETSQESVIRTRLTITTSITFEIQHQCQTTGNTNGLGIATTFSTDNEIYTTVEIVRGRLVPRTSEQYILIRDEKSSGTDGGTFTSGDWRTRDLNTIVNDDTGAVILSSDQFVLPAGTYRFRGVAPSYRPNRNQTRLQNITDGTTTLLGGSQHHNTPADVVGLSWTIGQFTISASKTFEFQHRGTTTVVGGFGIAGSFGTEVYATVEIVKIA